MKIFNKSKGILLFYIFDIVLFLILALTFIPFAKNKRVALTSAALNPKYTEEVSQITIEVPSLNESESVSLKKYGSIWIGSDSKTNCVWPCDSSSVKNLLFVLSKTVKMYKKSEKSASWESLGVDEESAKKITLAASDGTVFSKLYYGSEDGILKRICLRSHGQDKTFETENAVSTYLTADAQFWADPYIFPQAVTELSKEESENFLRRGQIISFIPPDGSTPSHTLTKIFENEADITLKFYDNGNNSYSVTTKINSSPFTSSAEHEGISKLNYSFSISSWTYEKLLEQ